MEQREAVAVEGLEGRCAQVGKILRVAMKSLDLTKQIIRVGGYLSHIRN